MISRQVIKSQVDGQLRRARSEMPRRVRAAFDQLAYERGLLTDDVVSHAGIFAHPLFELPLWVADRLRASEIVTSERQLADVLGVSALGYLHVRAQDDWLDGVSLAEPGPEQRDLHGSQHLPAAGRN